MGSALESSGGVGGAWEGEFDDGCQWRSVKGVKTGMAPTSWASAFYSGRMAWGSSAMSGRARGAVGQAGGGLAEAASGGGALLASGGMRRSGARGPRPGVGRRGFCLRMGRSRARGVGSDCARVVLSPAAVGRWGAASRVASVCTPCVVTAHWRTWHVHVARVGAAFGAVLL